jgi:hypothetical protein
MKCPTCGIVQRGFTRECQTCGRKFSDGELSQLAEEFGWPAGSREIIERAQESSARRPLGWYGCLALGLIPLGFVLVIVPFAYPPQGASCVNAGIPICGGGTVPEWANVMLLVGLVLIPVGLVLSLLIFAANIVRMLRRR